MEVMEGMSRWRGCPGEGNERDARGGRNEGGVNGGLNSTLHDFQL